MVKNIFITGSNGFVGKLLIESKNFNGIAIKSLTSRKSKNMKFDLNELFEKDSINFIHNAWNMSQRDSSISNKVNVSGSLNLIEELNQFKLNKLIFISTIHAGKDSKSVYEKHKYLIEKKIIENNGYVIKCGLIFEKNNFKEGFVGNIYKLTKFFPVLPNFSGKRKIYYTTDIEDLKNIIMSIVEGENVNNVTYCISDGPITYEELVKKFFQLEKPIINLPWTLGYFAAKTLELLKIPFPIKSDSLKAIKP